MKFWGILFAESASPQVRPFAKVYQRFGSCVRFMYTDQP